MVRTAIKQNAFGQAVFATQTILPNETIIRFTGPVLHRSEVPPIEKGGDDRFVQVSEDSYMGPSGKEDDIFNHSCNPNAGLRFEQNGIFLIALRQIAAGEEITWDYSTTMDEDDWELDCKCGSGKCRGLVRDFKHLPLELRKRYAALGVVPHYVLRYT